MKYIYCLLPHVSQRNLYNVNKRVIITCVVYMFPIKLIVIQSSFTLSSSAVKVNPSRLLFSFYYDKNVISAGC